MFSGIQEQLSNGKQEEPQNMSYFCLKGGGQERAGIEVLTITARFPVLLCCCTRHKVWKVHIVLHQIFFRMHIEMGLFLEFNRRVTGY